MLLIPQITFNDNLYLDAYSFSRNEIYSVTLVLEKASIEFSNEILTQDIKGRFGLRYLIFAREIMKLEQTLNLKFQGRGRNTKVILGETYFNATGNNETSFKCSRIDTPPHSCETVFAESHKEAIVKCALIANNKNWLGAVPSPGECRN